MPKNPCIECPFRKKSAPGWLGEHESCLEIVDLIRADKKFPCHVHVNEIADYLEHAIDSDDPLSISHDEALRQASIEAKHCVGALAFMNNTAKLSRDVEIARLQREVGKREDCFKSAKEMEEHHGKRKTQSQRH